MIAAKSVLELERSRSVASSAMNGRLIGMMNA
jgi:hypothetical protein